MRNCILSFLLFVRLWLLADATNHFSGIVASNAIGGQWSYNCRSQQQWNTLARDAKNAGFKSIRILGFDCDALPRASSAAAAAGITVLAGIYYSGTVASSEASINADVQTFKNAVRTYGAGRYAGLTVGNEVNDSANNIMNKVNQVRSSLRSSGINTPVSTVHVWVNIRNDRRYCDGDFIGANAHAFYDGGVTASQAGDFLSRTVIPALKATCPGKPVIITESGWPSRGSNFNRAVPSQGDERQALSSLNCAARGVSMYAFEYDDQLWKSNDNERSFGIFGKFNVNSDLTSAC